MAGQNGFAGFTRDTLSFFRELEQNNAKSWFEANKERYEHSVMAPARSLVAVLGERLTPAYPGINADARVNRSIFRIYRDVRFARDKSPYKTHLGILLWEGPGKKMECPGFYVHVEAEMVMLAGGLYRFSRSQLGAYRDAIVDPDFGPKLTGALDKALSATGATLGGQHYKRTPRGYDAGHPDAALLLHNGLYIHLQASPPEDLFSPAFADRCADTFMKMAPLHRALLEFVERARAEE